MASHIVLIPVLDSSFTYSSLSLKMKQVASRTVSFLARHAQIPRESSVDPRWQKEAGDTSKGLSDPALSDDEYILLLLKLRGIVSARDLRF